LAHRSELDQLSVHELVSISDAIRPNRITDKTFNNYNRYWNRFIKFAVNQGVRPPPSFELVIAFLTHMFLKTPSGKNCRNAKFALKNMCNWYRYPDPTDHPHVTALIEGMCNLSMVASKRDRSPWSISFIRKWVEVGRKFVSEKNYVMFTALMIFGIRSMFRGAELGSVRVRDVKLVTFPRLGLKMSVRKVKNDKEGRVVCIESTGSDLCPLKWYNRLLRIREEGPFLFAGKHSMNTVEISWILKEIAKWIGQPGNFSSHSLRIGGATEASFAGFSEAAIKAIGHWKSDAVDRYFRAEFSGERNISLQLGL